MHSFGQVASRGVGAGREEWEPIIPSSDAWCLGSWGSRTGRGRGGGRPRCISGSCTALEVHPSPVFIQPLACFPVERQKVRCL